MDIINNAKIKKITSELDTLTTDYTSLFSTETTTRDILLAGTTSKAPANNFANNMQPFYLANQENLKGKYLTKIAFKARQVPSVMSIVFKNVDDATTITLKDFTYNGVYCTITTDTTDWTEYDLTNLSDPRITFVTENLTDGKIFLPATGRVIGFGKNGEACYTGYNSIAPSINTNMAFYNVNAGAIDSSATLAFEIKTTITSPKKGYYDGKYLSILGDSISTYKRWIPTPNTNFYTGANYGVTSVNQTWWKRLIDETGMNLLVNNSWSGSKVTGSDAQAGCNTRPNALHSSINPDVILVYMGINDFNQEVAEGSYNGTQAFPSVTTTFREAYAIMLNKILTNYTSAEVYCCTLLHNESNGGTTFPEANDSGVLLETYNKAIREIASLFSVPVIEINQCGITYQNRTVFYGDSTLHPNSSGHKLIANKTIKTIVPLLSYSV